MAERDQAQVTVPGAVAASQARHDRTLAELVSYVNVVTGSHIALVGAAGSGKPLSQFYPTPASGKECLLRAPNSEW